MLSRLLTPSSPPPSLSHCCLHTVLTHSTEIAALQYTVEKSSDINTMGLHKTARITTVGLNEILTQEDSHGLGVGTERSPWRWILKRIPVSYTHLTLPTKRIV